MAIDYEEIVREIDDDKIKKLLTRLQIPFVDKGDFLVCKTACHNENLENASEKLYYYKNNKLFVCFTECGNMSIFKFLKNYYEARGRDYDWYLDIYLVVLNCSNYKNESQLEVYHSIKENKEHRKIPLLPEYDPSVLDTFVKSYRPEWLNDGITPAAMDKFGICYSISQNKIIIPHYDMQNRLIGIRGRALNPDEVEQYGKYGPIKVEGKWYSHPLSCNLYGLKMNYQNIKRTGICYLCESEKAVLQVDSWGSKNFVNCAVAVCGSQFNKWQLRQLLKYGKPKEIVICFDNEEKPGEDKYFNKLYNLCKKYSEYCNFSFVYDRGGLTNLKDSPTDHGPEIFKKLLKGRVKVNAS